MMNKTAAGGWSIMKCSHCAFTAYLLAATSYCWTNIWNSIANMLLLAQGYGRSLWVMHGMFRANGGCGYVRKPDILLKPDAYGEVFDPRASLPVKTTLKVS